MILYSLIALETDRPVSNPTACEQSRQGRSFCSGLTQLVKSYTSLSAVVQWVERR